MRNQKIILLKDLEDYIKNGVINKDNASLIGKVIKNLISEQDLDRLFISEFGYNPYEFGGTSNSEYVSFLNKYEKIFDILGISTVQLRNEIINPFLRSKAKSTLIPLVKQLPREVFNKHFNKNLISETKLTKREARAVRRHWKRENRKGK